MGVCGALLFYGFFMPRNSHSKTRPVSVRLTEQERALLERVAGKQSLSSFMRQCALMQAGQAPKPRKEQKRPTEQKVQLAQILALLGASDIFRSMSTFAKLSEQGAFPISEETESQIQNACSNILQIKTLLMRALRVKED